MTFCVLFAPAVPATAAEWILMPTPTDADLGVVVGDGAEHALAAGSGGTILEYDGVAWFRNDTETTDTIVALTGHDGQFFAATAAPLGQKSVVLRKRGSTWTADAALQFPDALDSGLRVAALLALAGGELLASGERVDPSSPHGVVRWLGADGWQTSCSGFATAALVQDGARLLASMDGAIAVHAEAHPSDPCRGTPSLREGFWWTNRIGFYGAPDGAWLGSTAQDFWVAPDGAIVMVGERGLWVDDEDGCCASRMVDDRPWRAVHGFATGPDSYAYLVVATAGSSSPRMARFDGTVLSDVVLPNPPGAHGLLDVWGIDDQHLFAVGQAGTIYTFAEPPPETRLELSMTVTDRRELTPIALCAEKQGRCHGPVDVSVGVTSSGADVPADATLTVTIERGRGMVAHAIGVKNQSVALVGCEIDPIAVSITCDLDLSVSIGAQALLDLELQVAVAGGSLVCEGAGLGFDSNDACELCNVSSTALVQASVAVPGADEVHDSAPLPLRTPCTNQPPPAPPPNPDQPHGCGAGAAPGWLALAVLAALGAVRRRHPSLADCGKTPYRELSRAC